MRRRDSWEDVQALAVVAIVAMCAAAALPAAELTWLQRMAIQPWTSAPAWLAAMAAGFWVCAGWFAIGPRVTGAALPCLALAGGGWLWWLAWTAAGAAMTLAAGAAHRRADIRRDQLARHLNRFSVLLDACQELSLARDGEGFAQTLCARAQAVAGDARAVSVHLGRGERLRLVAQVGVDPQSGKESDLGSVAQAAEDVRYVVAESRSLLRRTKHGLRMLLPLRGDRRRDGGIDKESSGGHATADSGPTRGCLTVALPTAAALDPLRREALEALGRIGGLGLAAVDLVDQTRAAALRDDLTGLYGHDEFMRRLEEQSAESRRRDRPLCLLLADLDHLKRFNDRFGHAAGDRALVAVAKTIRASIPRRAIACRQGGEEFAVILPGTTLNEARQAAEQLRRAVADVAIATAQSPQTITMSLGVAVLRKDETIHALIQRADIALYRAKAAGRDRTEAAE